MRRLQFCHYTFPHLNSNIPTALGYGVYILQLVPYARVCSLFSDFLQRCRILSTNMLSELCLKNRLILSSIFFRRYQHLVEKYSFSYVQMAKDGIGNYIWVQS